MTTVTRQWEVPTGKVLSMKTLTLIALMMPTMAFAGSNSDSQLAQRLQTQRQFDGGVSVRAVDKKYVDSAVAKLGGRATIEFGSKDQVSMGGVIVGSGADGLVSRSNTQAGAPIVVTPPVLPKTSITVVGRPSTGASYYCAFALKLGANGEVLSNTAFIQELTSVRDAVTADFRGEASKCGELGMPLRLAAGRYVVSYNNTLSVVDLKAQENKVIPLREVRVPKINGQIRFRIYRDFRSSVELRKALLVIKSDYYAPQGRVDEASIQQALSENAPGLLSEYGFSGNAVYEKSPFYKLASTQKTPSAKDGQSILVLPGQYNIEWDIDNQTDYTTGIRVD